MHTTKACYTFDSAGIGVVIEALFVHLDTLSRCSFRVREVHIAHLLLHALELFHYGSLWRLLRSRLVWRF